MPKRGENIRKRADGRWEGRYKTKCLSDGKTKYRSVYGKSYKEVKEKMRLCIIRETAVDTVCHSDSVLLKEAVRLWQSANKTVHKGATEIRYEYLLEKHILPELGELPLKSVSSAVLIRFMNAKLAHGRLKDAGGLSPRYVRAMMSVLTSVLQYAECENLCEHLNIHFQKPSVHKTEPSVLCAYDQKRLEAALYRDTDTTKLGILISLHMGLRIGEVCALTWDDVDLEKQIVHIRSTVARVQSDDAYRKSKLIIDFPKTKSSVRDIPIPSKLLPLITATQKTSESKYVISSGETFVSPRTHEYRYHKLLEEQQITSVTYHTLRHTFATRCIEVGMDVKTLSEILGHTNVSITLDTYVHSSMELKRRQLEKLSAASA